MGTLAPYFVRCLQPRPPFTGVEGGVGVGVGVAIGEGEGEQERGDPGTGEGDGEGVNTGECVGVVVVEYGVAVTSGVDGSVDVDEFLCLTECKVFKMGVETGEGVGVVEAVDEGE